MPSIDMPTSDTQKYSDNQNYDMLKCFGLNDCATLCLNFQNVVIFLSPASSDTPLLIKWLLTTKCIILL